MSDALTIPWRDATTADTGNECAVKFVMVATEATAVVIVLGDGMTGVLSAVADGLSMLSSMRPS